MDSPSNIDLDDCINELDVSSLSISGQVQNYSVLAYNSKDDPRLRHVSYSSRLTLHSCPRKYELYRLKSKVANAEDELTTLTFNYGHAVGTGIQDLLMCEQINFLNDSNKSDWMWKMFQNWNCSILADNPKQNKNIWLAIYAVQKFQALIDAGVFNNWELMYHEGKPAVELGFCITLPNGFKYRGSVDAVLQHKTTGAIRVLENKTSSRTVDSAIYKNSAQAIGYSIVLDAIAPNVSSYDVLYTIYNTKEYAYELVPFNKSYLQRARWIQELVLDCDLIATYIEADLFPMHGESCFDWNRECEYFGLCHMDNSRLVQIPSREEIAKVMEMADEYQIQVTLEELIMAQLGREAALSPVNNTLEPEESVL